MIDQFLWWTEDHKKLAGEVHQFVNDMMPRADEARWKREFPWDIFDEISKRGFTGAMIPREYGGLGLGLTGACIVAEEMCRMPNIGRVFIGNMLAGAGQILKFGTDEQKKRFLPRIAKGEIGAICITEPFAGTDAAAIETSAKQKNDRYVINGKKRYIVSAGLASRYMLYARTSNDLESIRHYKHLTGFIVERGMPGFTVEKINEITGFDEIQNGVLNLDNVSVPIDNRIGEEGEGWNVMMEGVNIERTLLSAQVLGWMRVLIETVVPYTQRRVQFGQRTADMVNNQLKIADLFIKLKMARLACYYNAYLYDNGYDIAMGAAIAKAFNCERTAEMASDTIQLMGGDGLTAFYMPATVHKISKVEEISGGTMEAMRLVTYRVGLKEIANDFNKPRRYIHKELGVPITTYKKLAKKRLIDEMDLLKVLADDYTVNPGLYMSWADIMDCFNTDDVSLNNILNSLEQKGLVKLYCKGGKIELAKATYEGLKKAYPQKHYEWFPKWVDDRGKF